jgi:hypothetical protein
MCRECSGIWEGATYGQQILPLLREIALTNDAEGFRELPLHSGRHGYHQVDDGIFDLLSLCITDLYDVGAALRWLQNRKEASN